MEEQLVVLFPDFAPFCFKFISLNEKLAIEFLANYRILLAVCLHSLKCDAVSSFDWWNSITAQIGRFFNLKRLVDSFLILAIGQGK